MTVSINEARLNSALSCDLTHVESLLSFLCIVLILALSSRSNPTADSLDTTDNILIKAISVLSCPKIVSPKLAVCINSSQHEAHAELKLCLPWSPGHSGNWEFILSPHSITVTVTKLFSHESWVCPRNILGPGGLGQWVPFYTSAEPVIYNIT